ncbi:hypothetical protein ABZP36_028943 [Zizania latifolia]
MVLLHPYFRGPDLVPSKGTDPEFLRRVQRNWGFVSIERYRIDHPFINPLDKLELGATTGTIGDIRFEVLNIVGMVQLCIMPFISQVLGVGANPSKEPYAP